MQDSHCKPSKRRKYDKIPVIICEWHQHVLPHIHRAIGSRHLPDSGLKMIHFDSHPDLTFPLNLPAEDCFDKEILYEKLEIADWILPLVYEKHLNELVWMKPPWANQIQDGNFSVSVGENRENQFLRISCKENYFLEELLYANDDDLNHSKKFDIFIKTMKLDREEQLKPSSLPEKDNNPQEFCDNLFKSQELESAKSICHADDSTYILDIDLDFFSTYNPFVLRHSKEDFQDLATIYKFSCPRSMTDDDIAESLNTRREQLKALQSTIKYFERNFISDQEYRTDFLNLIELDDHEIDETEICPEYLKLLKQMHEKEVAEGRRIDLELVHFAGMSSDLPHHRSTKFEIDQLMLKVERFLEQQPRPTLVTIARSSEDEYTPPDQVEYIQTKVIEMLERLYSKISLIEDYKLLNEDV